MPMHVQCDHCGLSGPEEALPIRRCPACSRFCCRNCSNQAELRYSQQQGHGFLKTIGMAFIGVCPACDYVGLIVATTNPW